MPNALKKQIRQNGCKLSVVADRAGVSRITFWRWIQGHQPNRADAILRAVCEATGWDEKTVLKHVNHSNHECNN